MGGMIDDLEETELADGMLISGYWWACLSWAAVRPMHWSVIRTSTNGKDGVQSLLTVWREVRGFAGGLPTVCGLQIDGQIFAQGRSSSLKNKSLNFGMVWAMCTQG